MSRTYTWTDADGGSHDLSDVSSWAVLEGAAGLDSAPTVNTTADFVGLDGAALIKRRRPTRGVVLPMLLQHPTRVMTQVAAVAKALQGPGELTVTDDTNTRTLLDVYYEAGLEGIRAKENGDVGTWRRFVVSLVALNPWWHDDAETDAIDTGSIAFNDGSTAFDAPGVPFDGGAATVLTIAGDAPAQPVWTIDGPYSKLVVGVQGGQSFELAGALADGDQIVIDTRPGSRGPRLNGGDVDWALLTAGSRLWELPVGAPVILAGGAGDDAGSGVSVTYRQRWLTP